MQKFLDYIYENFYKEIEKVRAYITPDMWAMQDVIPGGKDLAEQKLLRAAQEKLVIAWKRDANNPNSFERMFNVQQDNDQAVSDEGNSIRSEDSGTVEGSL